jgi:phenylalanyl-tRNA synthetase beta chain
VLADKESNYTKIRQILDNILNLIGVNVVYNSINDNRFISGRSASVSVNGKNIGIIGELNPHILSSLGIVVPVSALEIDIEALFDIIKKIL